MTTGDVFFLVGLVLITLLAIAVKKGGIGGIAASALVFLYCASWGIVFAVQYHTEISGVIAERDEHRVAENAAIQACVDDGGQWVRGACFTPSN